jgi:hypothetical protein
MNGDTDLDRRGAEVIPYIKRVKAGSDVGVDKIEKVCYRKIEREAIAVIMIEIPFPEKLSVPLSVVLYSTDRFLILGPRVEVMIVLANPCRGEIPAKSKDDRNCPVASRIYLTSAGENR